MWNISLGTTTLPSVAVRQYDTVGDVATRLANAISGNDNTSITTAAQNAMVGFNTANYTVSVTDTSGNALAAGTASAGTQIEVTVSATWSTIGAGFRPMNLIGGTKTVKGVCVMRKES